MKAKLPLIISSLFLVWLIACNASPFEQGKVLYESQCSSCHMDDGSGLKAIYPALKGNAVIWDGSRNLPCLIRNGLEANALSAAMPPFTDLTEVEISNILNYLQIMNDKKPISYSVIKEQLNDCKQQR